MQNTRFKEDQVIKLRRDYYTEIFPSSLPESRIETKIHLTLRQGTLAKITNIKEGTYFSMKCIYIHFQTNLLPEENTLSFLTEIRNPVSFTMCSVKINFEDYIEAM